MLLSIYVKQRHLNNTAWYKKTLTLFWCFVFKKYFWFLAIYGFPCQVELFGHHVGIEARTLPTYPSYPIWGSSSSKTNNISILHIHNIYDKIIPIVLYFDSLFLLSKEIAKSFTSFLIQNEQNHKYLQGVRILNNPYTFKFIRRNKP